MKSIENIKIYKMETPVIKMNAAAIAERIIDKGIHGNAIEVDNLTVSFKTSKGIYTAVKDISLSVKKGEIVSLIGHSGCGKSTLMGGNKWNGKTHQWKCDGKWKDRKWSRP